MIGLAQLYNEINKMIMTCIKANLGIGFDVGVVTEVNPLTHAAKVIIQPPATDDGQSESNWLQVAEPWASTGGSGTSFLPVEGDHVLIEYYGGSKQSAIIVARVYNDVIVPIGGVPGEGWIVHKTGSYFKLTNDGKLLLNGGTAIDLSSPTINIQATGDVNVMAASEVNITAPTTTVNGNLVVTGTINGGSTLSVVGDIVDLNGANGSLNQIRTVYNSHIHSIPDGETGPADPQMA